MQTKTAKESYKIVDIGNWHYALIKIQEKRGRVGRTSEFISARNNAEFKDNVWRYSAYLTAGLNFAPKNSVLLLRENSELLQLENAAEAVQLHKNNKEYPIAQDTYNSHLNQAEKESKNPPENRNILILPERVNFSINSQNHFDILRFLAEDPKQAEKYLGRLSGNKLNKINFYLRNKNYVDEQESPFQDQLCLHRFDYGSCLDGKDKNLGSDIRVFGMFPIDKASSKKSREASKMYEIVQEIRKGNISISDLESKLSQVSTFLENLSK